MTALATVLVLLVSIVTVVGALATLPIMLKATRDQWRRTPPEKRPRAIAGGVAAAAWIVLAAALSIAAPWGPHTFAYVILVGGGAMMVFMLVGVAIQAVQDSRRARRQHPGHG